jgi:hypothetical protein
VKHLASICAGRPRKCVAFPVDFQYLRDVLELHRLDEQFHDLLLTGCCTLLLRGRAAEVERLEIVKLIASTCLEIAST